MAAPIIGLIGAGDMGSAMAHRLHKSGVGTILTNLEGRSEQTSKRATECGMQNASYPEIISQASYILSVVPPKDAMAVAQLIAGTAKASPPPSRKVIFADCNATSPQTAKEMAKLFVDTNVTFIDGTIIGGPPSDVYTPGLYICADDTDEVDLDRLDAMLKKYGLQPFSLKGEGTGIGDASAVKMANAGIVKGAIALFASMILASHASSPSTSQALLHSLLISQSTFLEQMIRLVPQMTPKAYRFVGEMQGVAEFAQAEDDNMARIYQGTAQVFHRIAKAKEEGKTGDGGEIDVLLSVIEEAKKLWEKGERQSWAPPN